MSYGTLSTGDWCQQHADVKGPRTESFRRMPLLLVSYTVSSGVSDVKKNDLALTTSATSSRRPTSRTRAASPRTTPTSSARRRRRSRPFEGRRAAPHSSPFWSCAHAFLICPRPLLPHVFNVLFCVIQACARTDPAIFNSIILHAPGRKDGAEELQGAEVHAPHVLDITMF